MKQNVEIEIAILAGVLGFFVGGLLNVKKELLDIALSAVITGAIVFFTSYFAMVLVFSGKKRSDNDDGAAYADQFVEKNFEDLKQPDMAKTGDIKKEILAKKGKKVDFVSKDDGLFDDIYKMK
jgi:hypothetical protein